MATNEELQKRPKWREFVELSTAEKARIRAAHPDYDDVAYAEFLSDNRTRGHGVLMGKAGDLTSNAIIDAGQFVRTDEQKREEAYLDVERYHVGEPQPKKWPTPAQMTQLMTEKDIALRAAHDLIVAQQTAAMRRAEKVLNPPAPSQGESHLGGGFTVHK